MYASDTWGISGPEFLASYAVICVAGLICTLVLRKALTRRLVQAMREPALLTPPEIAILHSDKRAVAAAIVVLRSAGCLDGAASPVRQPGPGDDVDWFSRQVYHLMAQRNLREVNRLTMELAIPLRQLRTQMDARGLLTGPEYRRQVRLATIPLFAVLLLGIVRLVFGLATGHPVGWLLLMLAFVTLTLLLAPRTGRRTYLGNTEARVQQLRMLRRRREHRTAPSYDDAALSTAALGAAALWMFDPGLAGASGMPSSSDSGSSGGSGCGSSGSSCASGSSSCGSSSSSCGGGGSSGCGG